MTYLQPHPQAFFASTVAAWDITGYGNDDSPQWWAQDASQKPASFALPGGYLNLLGPDEHAQIDLACSSNTSRLRELKHKFLLEKTFTGTPLPFDGGG